MSAARTLSLLFALTCVLGGVFWWAKSEAPPAASAPGPSPRRLGALGQRDGLPRGPATLSGRVTRDGQPVKGAVVTATAPDLQNPLEGRCGCEDECGATLFECPCGAAGELLQALVEERRGESEPVARTQTATDGTFTLAGLVDGKLDVWADDPRWGTAVISGAQAGEIPVELELQGGLTFTGRVQRDHRVPVAGAHVAAISLRPWRVFETTSDASGSFTVGPLPKRSYLVLATAPGLMPEHAPARDGMRLVLSPPAVLTGAVTLHDRPVAGALVQLRGEHRQLETVTAEDGRFELGPLHAGAYEVEARHGELGARAQVAFETALSPLRLMLVPRMRVHGRVRDERGQPIADAGVTLRTDEWQHRATAGLDGTYAFSVVSADHAGVEANAPGYVAATRVVTLDRRDVELDLELQPEASVSGVVLDPSGGLLGDAVVRVVGGDEGSRSASDGTFVLHGLPPGSYPVRAAHNDFAAIEREVEAPATGVVLRLERGLTLSGQVVTRDGKGVEAVVRIEHDFVPEHQARSGPDGWFRLGGLVEGHATVSAETGEPPQKAGEVIELSAGRHNEVRLELGEPATISGVVLTAEGKLATGAAVSLSSYDVFAPGGSAITDSHGRFEIRGVRSVEYELSCWLDDAFVRVSARGGDTGVRVQLPSTTLLHGRVVGPGAQPVQAFAIDRHGVASKTGEFEVHRQRRYEGDKGWLEVEAAGFMPAMVRYPSTDRARLELGEIVLTPTIDLEVQVVDGDGHALGGAVVIALRVGTSAVTRSDGLAHLGGSPSGTTLVVRRHGYAYQELQLAAGERKQTVSLSRENAEGHEP
jgi:hypothetical protein